MLNEGRPYPLGATPDPGGVNFALAAPNATGVELCLFDTEGRHEQQRLPLTRCTDGVWHGELPSARPGLVYGWRVHGPQAPHEGHRFNPVKLLLDPYAREVVGRYGGEDIFHHDDLRDTAAVALKARVTAPLGRAPATRPGIGAGDRVIYELHVRGHTMRHPEVPLALRGSYAGLATPAVLDHLQRLGVTTLSLMPVHFRADEERLQKLGLANYWGYSSIGWFAPEARYWSGRPGTSPASEFRDMADAIHARGMELVIDVVYNHSAETDELGPTLSLRGIDNALYYRLRTDDPAFYDNWTGCGNCLDFTQPRVVQLCMDSLRHWHGELGVDGFRFDLAPILARSGGANGHAFDVQAPLLAALAQDPQLAQALLIAEPWDIGPGGYRLGSFPPGWLEWNDRFRDTQRAFWLHAVHPPVGRGEFAHRITGSSREFRHRGRAPTASVNFITAHDGFTLRDLLSYNERHNEANGEHNRDGHAHNLSRNCGAEGDTDDPAILAERRRLRRALLAVLMLSQGTPMLLAGDEIGHTQQGNNNAYCQDNDTTWLAWRDADGELVDYVARLAALRREAAPLRHARWWPAAQGGHAPGVHWLAPEGHAMTAADWERPEAQSLAVLFEAAPGAPSWLLLVNAEPRAVRFVLPPGSWQLRLASDHDGPVQPLEAAGPMLPSGSLWLATSSAPAAAVLR